MNLEYQQYVYGKYKKNKNYTVWRCLGTNTTLNSSECIAEAVTSILVPGRASFSSFKHNHGPNIAENDQKITATIKTEPEDYSGLVIESVASTATIKKENSTTF